MSNSKRTVYVVSIPWDSASVDSTRVFQDRADAEKYCRIKNESGYGYGYQGGLFVEVCFIETEYKEEL